MSLGRSRNESNLTLRSILRNIVRIITETGLRVYKELIAMKKDQVDLEMPSSGYRIPRLRTVSLTFLSRRLLWKHSEIK